MAAHIIIENGKSYLSKPQTGRGRKMSQENVAKIAEVLALIQDGVPERQICSYLGVSKGFISRVKKGANRQDRA